MKKFLLLFLIIAATNSPIALASSDQDLKKIRHYFQTRFPSINFDEFANGVYALNEDARYSWQEIEQFPPYEDSVEEGKRLFETPFKNGRQYSDCFENKGIAIAHKYPYWDNLKGHVITLALAINECRKVNSEKTLNYKRGEIVSLLSYMAFTSRGNRIKIVIPKKIKAAQAAYENGKKFYYTRRGQLNFSCATCHIQNAGLRTRAETLSPAIGHATGWPVYREKWQELGTLHRRFIGCSKQIRAKSFKAQSEVYRNLEYFLTYMSNGLPFNGPSYRK